MVLCKLKCQYAASGQGSGSRGRQQAQAGEPVEADEDPLLGALGGCAGGNHPPAARDLHRPEKEGGKQRA